MAMAVLAMSAVSAFSQFRQGQAQSASLKGQARGLDVQADFERLRGRQEALKHKKQANDKLQSILEAMARTTAVAGAGNIDPFSGNPEGIRIKGLNVGGTDVITAKENAQITTLVAKFQADQLNYQATRARLAAREAKKAGVTNALMTLGQGMFMYGQLGGTIPGFGAATPASTFASSGFGAGSMGIGVP
jgi:hypothetical protein